MRKQYDAYPGKTSLAAGATPNASKGGDVLITCRPGVAMRQSQALTPARGVYCNPVIHTAGVSTLLDTRDENPF